MNKRIIIVIAVSLAVLLIGAAVVFVLQSRNDTVKDDEAVKDDTDKESISSETDDFETTGDVDSEPDDSELKETEGEEKETDKASAESQTETEKETTASVKDPAETKTPSKKPAETKPAETKAPSKKPAATKPAETKPAETKPAETKPAETKPANPDRNEFASPDFTVYDGNGNKVRLSDFAGKPVILNYWASWCTPCKKEMPDFNEKYLEYGDEIQFLMVDFAKDDKIEDAKAYVAEMGFEFPVYFDVDGEAAQTYKVDAFPTTVFFDAEGNVVERYRGTISEETLQSGIDKILE